MSTKPFLSVIELRHRAEAILQNRPPSSVNDLREFQLRQIELEIQNEELRLALEHQSTRCNELERWQFALEGIGDGIWDYDVPSGRVFFSRQWKQMLGYSEDEIGDTDDEWSRRVHPNDMQGVTDAIQQKWDSKTSTYEYEYRLQCKDGSYKWILDRGVIVSRDENDQPLRIVGMQTDISERKMVEQMLRDSKVFATTTIDAVSAHLCVLDKTGKILAVNQAWRDFQQTNSPSTTPLQDTVGMNYLAVCDTTLMPESSDAAAMAAGIRSIIKGNLTQFEIEYACHSPVEKRWFVARVTCFNDGSGNMVVAHENITQRKLAEEKLHESVERLDGIVQSAMDAIITVTEDQRIILFNHAAEKMFRYSANGVIGQPIAVLIPPRFQKIHHKHIETFGQTGITNRAMGHLVALSAIRADGVEFPIEASISQGNVTDKKVYTVILRDITERKNVEEAERKQRLLSEALRETAAALNTTLNFDHLSILHVLQLIVDKAIEILPNAEQAIIHTIDEEGFLRPQVISGSKGTALNTGRPLRMDEGLAGLAIQSLETIVVSDIENDSRYVKRNNSSHFRSIIVCPIVVHGNVMGVLSLQGQNVGVFSDAHREIISLFSQQAVIALENVRHFEMQKEKHQQAVELQKLAEDALEKERAYHESQLARASAEAANEAKSIFLAKMSHELRTPLNGISGYIQLLEHDPSLGEKQKEQIKIISRSSDHLLNLINGILTLSKVEAGEMELTQQNIHLPMLILGLDELFRAQAQEKTILWQTMISPGVPSQIVSDETKLRQILINLLGNAFKFTKQGHVFLTLTIDHKEGQSILLFQVEDTGSGVPQHRQTQLFNTLTIAESISKVESGAGLGLLISRQFARMMGGDISFSSEEGKGSIFCLRMPYNPTLIVETGTEHKIPFELPSGDNKMKALVVDDDDVSLNLLNNILLEIGFEIRLAKNGKEAVELALIWQPPFIFMDLRMPEMDGFAAMSQIRAQISSGYHPIIIAVTASVFESEVEKITRSGFEDLVHKPYKFQQIYNVIQKQVQNQSKTNPTNGLPSNQLPPATLGDLSKGQVEELMRLVTSGHTKQAIEFCLEIQKENAIVGSFLLGYLQEYKFDLLLSSLSASLKKE